MSQSKVYARGVEAYIGEHQHFNVREKPDEIYSAESSALEPAILNAQAASLREEEW